MLASFHMTPNSLCANLSHMLVLTGWWAHPNCDLVLNCAGSSRRFLRQKLQDGKCISSSELAKYPYASFVKMDGVLLEVRNRKEKCCTWSLIATTSRILALKLTVSLSLMIRSLSSFVSNPYLTFVSSACILFSPNQVYPLVCICHWTILWWFRKHLSFALVELVYRWFWASTLHGVSPLLNHVVMISTVRLCIHLVQLSKRMSSPIAPMIDSVWNLLPRLGILSLTLEFEKVLFHPERPIKKSRMDDREDLLLSIVLILDILLATWSMRLSSFLVPRLSKSQDKISFKGGGL
jgi:hypothetical protein